MNPSIFYENVEVRIVPHYPDNGYLFYVSRDGTVGLRIAPNGTKTVKNATPTTCVNCKNPSNANRTQRYLQFKQAFGNGLNILVSHAVYRAWSGKTIPPYHQIHHLTGIVTDNRLDNLLCVHILEHRTIADARQQALRTVVPNGDLKLFSYERLRELQDPRTMSDEAFQRELELIREKDYHIAKPDDAAEPNKYYDPFVEN